MPNKNKTPEEFVPPRRSTRTPKNNTRPVRFMGLDLSLNSTGVSLIDENGEIVDQRLIKQDKVENGCDRLFSNRHALQAILVEWSAEYDLRICLEGYAMGVRGGRLASIGEWGGIARMCLYDLSMTWHAVSPSALKKFVTGKGSGGKELMLLGVYKVWGKELSQDDLCDAYALAQVARHLHNKEVMDIPAYRNEVLEKIILGG